ncbi:uncharacterized protein LAESUDRAFT_719314 [Laetiporus sulphureus 93-53]|uniref:Uncharacterized protein n=1 Tax=Laetiporus sulphureus 93-53 TaxID=1314785 RepID=A0A165IFP5_9APHY|nr:uncharacterized protein LAESUDRAFT_719314 [Laetiporus sulphureus 93-53]KZT13008.1 hypothetical protein LAESUDRAFT_719314 [Laetiporus sulphureus 93-53]
MRSLSQLGEADIEASYSPADLPVNASGDNRRSPAPDDIECSSDFWPALGGVQAPAPKADRAAKHGSLSSAEYKEEKLPFFGPPDPARWPAEKSFFLAGFLFFPCWIFGGFWRRGVSECDTFAELFRWRCQVMAMLAVVIGVGLLAVEITSRE